MIQLVEFSGCLPLMMANCPLPVLHSLAVFARSCYYLSRVLGVTPVMRLKWRLR
jgi:hypothetical protein